MVGTFFVGVARGALAEPAATAEAPESLNPLRVVVVKAPGGGLVRLAGVWVDPVQGRTLDGASADLSAADAPVADELRVVQLEDRLDEALRARWLSAGFRVLGYLPDNAYVVRIPQRAVSSVRAWQGVRWLGNYAPEYRIAPRLARALQGLSASETLSIRLFWEDGREERREATPEEIQVLAALPGVLAVEYAPQPRLHNNVAAGIVETRPLWTTRGLAGSNQIVAVADSGLDIGTTNTTVHPDFLDGAGRSRVLALLNTAGYGVADANGHGTHVAGSVLGNGFLSGSDPTNDLFPTNSYAGSAPKARLVFQSIGSNTTSSVYPPSNLNDLFQPAYDLGARVHHNSWGSAVAGDYTRQSCDADEFAFHHPDLLIVFSAGNNGADLNPSDGVVDLGSLGAPASAKNVLAVGASENLRPTLATTYAGFGADYPNEPISTDRVANVAAGMAAFSSRGPAADGRIKPDLVAPGTYIISTRSRAASSTGWGVPANTNYIYNGGTSMSSPLVSGAAALLREWLSAVHALTNPPAVLLKALLLNGAQDLAPGQYGTGAFLEIPAPPNSVEGWGRLRLEGYLYGTSDWDVQWMDGWSAPLTNTTTVTNFFTVRSTSTPLKVHLAWNDYHGSQYLLDAGRTEIAGGGLVNDLGLVVTSPSGTPYLPLAQNTNVALFYHTNRSSYSYYTTAQLFDAQRCSAPELPLKLTHLDHLVRDTNTLGGSIASYIWADSGGVPGAVLFSQTNTLGAGGGLWSLVLPVSVTITNPSFFIGSQHLTGSNIRQIRDPGSSSRAFYRTASWAQGGGDLWMHVYGTTPSNDHANNVLGLVVNEPATGVWRVTVSGEAVPRPPARYAVVLSGALKAPSNSPPGQVELISPAHCPDAGEDGSIANDDFTTFGRLLNPRPKLIWQVPSDPDGHPVHFKVYAGTTETPGLLADSSNSTAGFEYGTGTVWVSLPAAGAPTVNAGAKARYKPASDFATPTAHYWRVVAKDAALEGPGSATNRFVLGGRAWTDPVLGGLVMRPRKPHLDELREEANYARASRLYPTQAWSGAIVANLTPVRAVFFTELRAALAEVTNATGETLEPFPEITPGVTPVTTNFLLELRRALDTL